MASSQVSTITPQDLLTFRVRARPPAENHVYSKMPIQEHYQIPPTAQNLPIPDSLNAKLYVAFIASIDPATKQSWCPDVRAALPRLQKAFASDDAPQLLYVHVGQKSEWKDLGNVYRTKWNVRAVPQLVRYQRVGGEVRETGSLVEAEVNDEVKLRGFVEA